jgi:hypothetical protein
MKKDDKPTRGTRDGLHQKLGHPFILQAWFF